MCAHALLGLTGRAAFGSDGFSGPTTPQRRACARALALGMLLIGVEIAFGAGTGAGAADSGAPAAALRALTGTIQAFGDGQSSRACLGVSASFAAAAERAFATRSCHATARVLTFDATLAAELPPGEGHPSAKVAGATITFEFRRLHGAPTPVVMSRAAPGHWLVERVGSLG
jgi:hypothetical protein